MLLIVCGSYPSICGANVKFPWWDRWKFRFSSDLTIFSLHFWLSGRSRSSGYCFWVCLGLNFRRVVGRVGRFGSNPCAEFEIAWWQVLGSGDRGRDSGGSCRTIGFIMFFRAICGGILCGSLGRVEPNFIEIRNYNYKNKMKIWEGVGGVANSALPIIKNNYLIYSNEKQKQNHIFIQLADRFLLPPFSIQAFPPHPQNPHHRQNWRPRPLPHNYPIIHQNVRNRGLHARKRWRPVRRINGVKR